MSDLSSSRTGFNSNKRNIMRSRKILPPLAIETLHDIVLYLPRHVLRSLLAFQPHPLGQIASYVYFSTLSLHFGVRLRHRWYLDVENDGLREDLDLLEWHDRRSHEILTTIIEGGANFAQKVRRLKIYAPGSLADDELEYEIGLLNSALPKLKSLKVLEYEGLLLPLRATIKKLSKMVPHLQALRLSDTIMVGGTWPPSKATLRRLSNLKQLTLCYGWHKHISFIDLTTSSVKNVHITAPSIPALSQWATSPFMHTLTHLSVTTDSFNSISPFEIALKYGVNLQSLRIRGCLESTNAHHFRRYADALPFLTEFGIHLVNAPFSLSFNASFWVDTDFFPAICAFLRRKAAQLVHLEVIAPTNEADQEKLGFDGGKVCWDMFKPCTPYHRGKKVRPSPFSRLESLSITIPAGQKNFSRHYSNLIPKGVTRLTLAGEQLPNLCPKIFAPSFDKKRPPSWPPRLRLVSLNISMSSGYMDHDQMLVESVAECISTVRVVKIVIGLSMLRGFWSVSPSAYLAGSEVCTKWSSRQSTVFKEEMLDQHECEDTWFNDY